MSQEGKRLLVTGGTGFVGTCLLDQIEADVERWGGWAVTSASRSAIQRSRVGTLIWDLSTDGLPESDVEYDVIIHTATPASAVLNAEQPAQMFWMNVIAMQRVLQLAERLGSAPTIVFTSSGAVYGDMPAHLTHFPEGFVGAPQTLDVRSAYAEGKRAAEYLLTEATSRGVCKGIVLRLFAFSGVHLPRDRHFAVGNFVRDAVESGEIVIRSDGSAIRSYLDGSDMARWILAAVERGEPGFAYHIGSDLPISIGGLGELVATRSSSILGREVHTRVLGTAHPLDGVSRYVPDVAITKQLLGVDQLVCLEESIDQMLRSHQASHSEAVS